MYVGIIATVAPLLALWWIVRWASARRAERLVEARHHRNANGVIAGAEEIALDGGPAGVLLLHGFGDTPQSLGDLARHLHEQGFTVRVPRLPGHGRRLHDFAASSGAEWLEAAREALAALCEVTSPVALVGQSMGGALAVILAAEREVAAVVLLAPYLTMPPTVDRVARYHRLAQLATVYVDSRTEGSIRDPVARLQSLGYGRTTPRLLAELRAVVSQAWDALPRVAVPTLVLQSRLDTRIRPADAERAFARLQAVPRELVWVDGGGHVLAVDVGYEAIFEHTVRWLGRFVRQTTP